jgi:hypothetical protein
LSAPSLPTTVDCIVVEFPATEGYRSVGRLVLGGLLSRFELPVDRVEDLLLAVESLLVQGIARDTVTVEATVAPDGLHVKLGPFAGTPLADPGVSRVVTPLVDEVSEESAEAGTRVELQVSAARLTAASKG